MGGDDHRCEWRDEAEALRAEVTALRAEFANLGRHVFGQRSEKMPPVAEEVRRAGEGKADPEATLAKRRENAEKRKQLPSREIHHTIPVEKKCCPKCGGGVLAVWRERSRRLWFMGLLLASGAMLVVLVFEAGRNFHAG